MAAHTYVKRPETFDMVVWDGTNDAEIEALSVNNYPDVWGVEVVHTDTTTLVVFTSFNDFVRAEDLKVGTGVCTKGTPELPYSVLDSAEYELYENVYVTPAQ